MERPRRWLVAYDITEDHRRERIAHLLDSYGDRVQYSVFIVDARPAKLIRLRAGLAAIMDPLQDSVLFADLGPVAAIIPARFSYLGRHRATTPIGPFIV